MVLRELVSRRVKYDVIIADPPYNIGKDFGNGNAVMPLNHYVDWACGWIRDCMDLLAYGGLLYVYGFAEILAHVAVQFNPEQQRWLVWHYTNKTVPSLQFWQRSHETVLCLWNGDSRPVLEVDQIREPYTDSFLHGAAGRTRKNTPSRYGGKSGKTTIYQAHESGALPRDVIKVPALAGGAGRAERWFMCRTCENRVYPPSDLGYHRDHDTLKHPTQKPKELTRRLLLSRIPKGDESACVLIPFAGSGSECVVARDLGIPFLGIELNPEYVDFANQWLSITEVSECTV